MVTVTINLDERTAERLRERAAREGTTLEALVAEAMREQAELGAPSSANAEMFGLEPDDPLLDLIGLLGDTDEDAVAVTRGALDEFYRSHLDRPR